MVRRLALVLTVALAAAACSDSSSTTTSAEPAVTTAAPASPVATTPPTTAPMATSTTTSASTQTSSTQQAPDTTQAPTGPENVAFATSDGVELEGRVFPGGDTWFVLAHMRPADMASWFETSQYLVDQGFSALAFNFRGYGDSGGDGFAVDVDTEAAIDFVRERGASRVFVVGASMGGTGAVQAAVTRAVDGVVTLSAPGVFEGVDALGAATVLEAPLVAISAVDDQPYAGTADELVAGAGSAAELVILDGSAHGTNLLTDYRERIRSILVDIALGP